MGLKLPRKRYARVHAPHPIRASRVPALDGLRAIAILPVIAFHVGIDTKFPMAALGPGMFPVVFGWIGVDLFFALSGFLITRLWIEDENAGPVPVDHAQSEPRSRAVLRFYGRRALRILPPLYAVLVLNLLVLPHFGSFPSIAPLAHTVKSHPGAAVPYVLLYMNYVPHVRAGMAFIICWSLCVEEHFYLFWPWVLTHLRSKRSRLAVALALCVLVGVARAIAAHYLNPHRIVAGGTIDRASHFRIDSILWGAVAALAFEELKRRVVLRRAVLAGALGAALALMATHNMGGADPATALSRSLGFPVLAIGGALLTVETVAAPKSLWSRVLASWPLRTIGFLSYGMYLLHVVAIDFAFQFLATSPRPATPGLFCTIYALAVAITLTMALALRVVVEKPVAWARSRMRRPKASRQPF